MIGIFYGTRPEYIKLLPVLDSLDQRGVMYHLVQLGQHTTLIEGCKFDEHVKVSNRTVHRLNDIFHTALGYSMDKFKYVLVQGDTTTAVAVAQSAFNQGVPVMHVEAGMRTYDKKNPFPEEVNRRIISSLATVHYCPTLREKNYLQDEGFSDDAILVVGNTVIDNLQGRKSTQGKTVVVTMHRRENQSNLKDWYQEIESLASEFANYDFVFPMHPSPQVQKHKGIFKHVRVIGAVDHETILDMLASCHCVITDSGGVQEESSFFGKRCFVCRTATERPCPGQELCKSPEDLYLKFTRNFKTTFNEVTPFGDGHAGEKIAEDIQRRIR